MAKKKLTTKKDPITQVEIDKLKKDSASHPVYIFLRNKDAYDFNVGDIIVRYSNCWDYQKNQINWRLETISSSNAAPKRYKVVYKDEYGICYYKQLLLDGTLSDQLHGTHQANNEYTRFEIDKDYATLALIGEENNFDPIEKAKELRAKRASIKTENKKKIIKFKKKLEVQNWIDTVKVGDKYWGHTGEPYIWNYDNINSLEIEVVEIITFDKDPKKQYKAIPTKYRMAYSDYSYIELGNWVGSAGSNAPNTRTVICKDANGTHTTLWEGSLYGGAAIKFCLYGSKPESLKDSR